VKLALFDSIGSVSSTRDRRAQVLGSKKNTEPHSTYILGWRLNGTHKEAKEYTRPRHLAGGRVGDMKEKRRCSTKLLALKLS